jgi:hypothetical protein
MQQQHQVGITPEQQQQQQQLQQQLPEQVAALAAQLQPSREEQAAAYQLWIQQQHQQSQLQHQLQQQEAPAQASAADPVDRSTMRAVAERMEHQGGNQFCSQPDHPKEQVVDEVDDEDHGAILERVSEGSADRAGGACSSGPATAPDLSAAEILRLPSPLPSTAPQGITIHPPVAA